MAPTDTVPATQRPESGPPADADPTSMRPARAPFAESHRRMIPAPLDEVWPACLAVTASEIRAFGPLIRLRGLPARLLGRNGVATERSKQPLLDLFAAEGFVQLLLRNAGSSRRVEFGAIGRFWSPTDNAPVRFDSANELMQFDEPGHARIWFDLAATEVDGGTLVSTTTIVDGTNRWAERRFAPYWTLIRLPSGLIRRSWLAAIERRVRR